MSTNERGVCRLRPIPSAHDFLLREGLQGLRKDFFDFSLGCYVSTRVVTSPFSVGECARGGVRGMGSERTAHLCRLGP